jgi:hypothetical protein
VTFTALPSPFPGILQLIREPFDRLLVGGNFGLQQLQGHFFFDICIEDFLDSAHSSFAEFFDNLIPAGKGGTSG